MCGLYGYSTHSEAKLTKKQVEIRTNILAGLAVAMQERGNHSTGVGAVVKPKGKHAETWAYVKQAEPANKFVNTPDFRGFMEQAPRVVIGHTRYGTVGEINNDNAHPFAIGNIVGCHNGHVSNWKEVYPEGEVDSEAIFASLDKHNNDYKTALAEVRGKFAITWFNGLDLDKLYFVVDGNPLHLIRIKELQTYFWASLAFPLEAVLRSHFKLDGSTMWSPKPETVYEMTGKHQIKKTKVKFNEYTAPAYTSNYSNYSGSMVYGKDAKSLQSGDKTYDHRSHFEGWDEEDDVFGRSVHNDGGLSKSDEVAIKKYTTPPTSSIQNSLNVYDLQQDQMELIVSDMDEGCGLCDTQFDLQKEGMYYDADNELLICSDCAFELENFENIMYLEMEDVLEIEAELAWIEELDEEDAKAFFQSKKAEEGVIVHE